MVGVKGDPESLKRRRLGTHLRPYLCPQYTSSGCVLGSRIARSLPGSKPAFSHDQTPFFWFFPPGGVPQPLVRTHLLVSTLATTRTTTSAYFKYKKFIGGV